MATTGHRAVNMLLNSRRYGEVSGMKTKGVLYGTLKWTWLYRVWTGSPGARQRDSGGGKSKGQRQAPLWRRGPQASALEATRPSAASRHSRPHKETAHSQNTLPVGAGDVCAGASARSPREHLRTCRPPAPFSPARRGSGPEWRSQVARSGPRPPLPPPPALLFPRSPRPARVPGRGSRPGGRRRPLVPWRPPAHSPGSAANGDRETRSGERRRPAVAAAAT